MVSGSVDSLELGQCGSTLDGLGLGVFDTVSFTKKSDDSNPITTECHYIFHGLCQKVRNTGPRLERERGGEGRKRGLERGRWDRRKGWI